MAREFADMPNSLETIAIILIVFLICMSCETNPDAAQLSIGKRKGSAMDWSEMFFQNWSGIVRTLVVGTLAYAILVLSLRVSGKRTPAKLNAFDFVITVALGSTLATILLSEGVALAEGITAFILLITLQYVVAAASVRSKSFAKLVRSEPTLLAHNGQMLPDAMHNTRVTDAELATVIRTSGHCDISDIGAVILESDGSFSIIAAKQMGDAPILHGDR